MVQAVRVQDSKLKNPQVTIWQLLSNKYTSDTSVFARSKLSYEMENKSLQEGKIPKKRKFELDVCE